MAPITCSSAFKKLDMFPLNMNLKYHRSAKFRTGCGAMMTLGVVFLTLIYSVISYTELRASITSYTITEPMN